MSNHKLQPVRGTKDLFGNEILAFSHIVKIAARNAKFYGFDEIQTPIFEFSEVFESNLGESSDIISKEVYKFKDRGDNFLTLRPEFTAAIVRAFLSNGELQQILPQKLFSHGPIFRYDRPQKGRQRQFHQINFEFLGEENYYSDVEIILLASSILKDLQVFDKTTLEINSLGSEKTKSVFEEELKNYFAKYQNDLSSDSKLRLEQNPLRILDSKNEIDKKISAEAPLIENFFSNEERARFDDILNLLDKFKIPAKVNHNLVRGLDYYTSTVFEFIMPVDGAQNTVLAGGRYDNLISKMGGGKIPAIGFAAGIERLSLLSSLNIKKSQPISVNYISEDQKFIAFQIAQNIRKAGFSVEFFHENFKKQMKKSNQINCRFVLIIGENEIANNEVIIKDFINSSEDKISQDLIIKYLQEKNV